MGIFETIFRKPRSDIQAEGYFKMLNGYSPVFTNAPESLYEMELTRAAIHSFANFCSKLKPEISGTAYKNLERVLQFRPNPFMDTSKFIYRIATILSVNTRRSLFRSKMNTAGSRGIIPCFPSVAKLSNTGARPSCDTPSQTDSGRQSSSSASAL